MTICMIVMKTLWDLFPVNHRWAFEIFRPDAGLLHHPS